MYSSFDCLILNDCGSINLYNHQKLNVNSFLSTKQLKLINQKAYKKTSNYAYKDKSAIKESGNLFNISTQLWQKLDFAKFLNLSNKNLSIFHFSVVNWKNKENFHHISGVSNAEGKENANRFNIPFYNGTKTNSSGPKSCCHKKASGGLDKVTDWLHEVRCRIIQTQACHLQIFRREILVLKNLLKNCYPP